MEKLNACQIKFTTDNDANLSFKCGHSILNWCSYFSPAVPNMTDRPSHDVSVSVSVCKYSPGDLCISEQAQLAALESLKKSLNNSQRQELRPKTEAEIAIDKIVQLVKKLEKLSNGSDIEVEPASTADTKETRGMYFDSLWSVINAQLREEGWL